MSASVRTQVDDRKIELGTSVNWPPIYAAAGLGALVLTAIVVLWLLAGTPTAPPTIPPLAQRNAGHSLDEDSSLPPMPEPAYQPRDSQPPAAITPTTTPDVPEQPKLPSKPVVVAKPIPKPVVEPTPVPEEPTKVVESKPVPSFKRLSPYGEDELRERLNKESRELDVETEKGTTAKLLAEVTTKAKTQSTEKDAKPATKTTPVLELIAKRDDLKGLPVREVEKCQVPEKEAKSMAEMSRTVRNGTAKLKAKRDTSHSSYGETMAYNQELSAYMDRCLKGKEWHGEAGVRMLVQMFQIEDAPIRMKMNLLLTETKGKSATAALAERALFDLNPDIRLAAIMSLKARPAAEVRPVLLERLRYPWSPVADNAAEALVALNDREAVAELVALLDKPDPQAPIQTKDKKWVEPELVRINHLGNCVLCHAPCSAKEDTVRGLVPERGEPLPVVYYDSRAGNFVRADVTYLKQDFSAMQAVEKPGKWPGVQRFDYLIRQREMSDDEVSLRNVTKDKTKSDVSTYPQREAVLWALRQLTGKDLGEQSEAWCDYVKQEANQREP